MYIMLDLVKNNPNLRLMKKRGSRRDEVLNTFNIGDVKEVSAFSFIVSPMIHMLLLDQETTYLLAKCLCYFTSELYSDTFSIRWKGYYF